MPLSSAEAATRGDVDRLLKLGADPGARNEYGVAPGGMRAWVCVLRGRETFINATAIAANRGGGGNVSELGAGREDDCARVASKTLLFKQAASDETDSINEGNWTDGQVAEDREGAREVPAYLAWAPTQGGCNTSCLRLRDAGERPGDEPVVKMLGQLLRGAAVREVWDLQTGARVRYEREIVVQLLSKADARADFGARE